VIAGIDGGSFQKCTSGFRKRSGQWKRMLASSSSQGSRPQLVHTATCLAPFLKESRMSGFPRSLMVYYVLVHFDIRFASRCRHSAEISIRVLFLRKLT
jgi:hypothetical protein